MSKPAENQGQQSAITSKEARQPTFYSKDKRRQCGREGNDEVLHCAQVEVGSDWRRKTDEKVNKICTLSCNHEHSRCATSGVAVIKVLLRSKTRTSIALLKSGGA
jgi:hypothetical protein